MSFSDACERLLDPYERKARLFPALLALSPALFAFVLIYGAAGSVFSGLMALAFSCGLLYFLSNVSRDLGKRKEDALFKKWGGKPSTQLLRHRDQTIDRITKERYHNALSHKIGRKMPTPEEELANPSSADDVYRSAVIWLLSQTRDTKRFGLIFNENMAYGFQRNALGLKPAGIAISVLVIFFVAVKYKILTMHGIDILAARNASDVASISLGVATIMLLSWLFFFTESSLRRTANTYAEALLKSCDDEAIRTTPSNDPMILEP